MSIQIGASGVWKAVSKVCVGVSGAWKEVNNIWVGAGGAWKLLHQDITVALSNKSHSASEVAPTDAVAGYRIHSDGTVDGNTASAGTFGIDDGTWLLAGSASDYEVRATIVSGSLSSGTTGTWLACGTTRTWIRNFTGNNGSAACVLTIEIRDAATATVRASCTVSLDAAVSP